MNNGACDVSILANNQENSFTNQSMLNYQVGDMDENGFICIGIEERKLNQTMTVKGNGQLDDVSDYSSSDGEYMSNGSDSNKSRASKYKESLDFLVEQ